MAKKERHCPWMDYAICAAALLLACGLIALWDWRLLAAGLGLGLIASTHSRLRRRFSRWLDGLDGPVTSDPR
jgi:hypothetical protein